MNTELPNHDGFKSRQIALRLPLLHDVIAGKTLTGIARERGQLSHEIDNLFGQLILWLRLYCDPYFPTQHPEAVAVRPGVGLPRLVREHAGLYLALADRHARMVALSQHINTLDETERNGIDITAGAMFPPYLRAQFVSKQIATLGNLLQKTEVDLRRAEFDDNDIVNIKKMLAQYGLALTPVPPTWITDNETREVPIEALNLTVRTLNCLRADDIRTANQLAKMNDADLLKLPNLGRKAITEIRDKLASYETQRTDPVLPSRITDDEITGTPIESLNLTARTLKCLRSEGICTASHLAKLSVADLLKIPNLGKKAIMEIRNKLASCGAQGAKPA
jgi:hypothetical protein